MNRTESAVHRSQERTEVSNTFRCFSIKIARSRSSSLEVHTRGKILCEREEGDPRKEIVVGECGPPGVAKARSCAPDPQPLVVAGITVVAVDGVRPFEIAFLSGGGVT